MLEMLDAIYREISHLIWYGLHVKQSCLVYWKRKKKRHSQLYSGLAYCAVQQQAGPESALTFPAVWGCSAAGCSLTLWRTIMAQPSIWHPTAAPSQNTTPSKGLTAGSCCWHHLSWPQWESIREDGKPAGCFNIKSWDPFYLKTTLGWAGSGAVLPCFMPSTGLLKAGDKHSVNKKIPQKQQRFWEYQALPLTQSTKKR